MSQKVKDIGAVLIAGEESQIAKFGDAVAALRDKQVKIQEMADTAEADEQAAFAAGEISGWDKAMAQANVPPTEKVYTEQQWQEEMVPRDQKIAEQSQMIDSMKMDAELKDKELADVKAELEALKAQPGVDVEAVKVAAKAEAKAEINAAIDAFQAQVLA